MADPREDVTTLLGELNLGRKDAQHRLIPLVYRELRRMAGGQMRAERVIIPCSPRRLSMRLSCASSTRAMPTGRTARIFMARPRN